MAKKKTTKRPKAQKLRQIGSSSTKHDKRFKAKPPGKRRSASGKTYYERRKNRSDTHTAGKNL